MVPFGSYDPVTCGIRYTGLIVQSVVGVLVVPVLPASVQPTPGLHTSPTGPCAARLPTATSAFAVVFSPPDVGAVPVPVAEDTESSAETQQTSITDIARPPVLLPNVTVTVSLVVSACVVTE